MNEKELAEIEKRAEAATPGPWLWDMNRRYRSVMLKARHDGGTCVMDFTRWGMHSAQPRFNDNSVSFGGILRTAEEYDKAELANPNADFIAHARQDVPALVAEVRRLNNLVEALAIAVEDETGMLSDAPLTAEKLEEILHTLKDQRDYAAETAEMHAKEVERLRAALEDIAHGPVGYWNLPENMGESIRQMCKTASNALKGGNS